MSRNKDLHADPGLNRPSCSCLYGQRLRGEAHAFVYFVDGEEWRPLVGGIVLTADFRFELRSSLA